VLNFKGAGAISSTIGTDVNTGISQLNINTEGLISKTVTASGDIWSESINLKNAGVLTLAANTNLVGTTAVAVSGAQQSVTTDTANTGALTLIGGGHAVTGGVGSNAAPIGTINAGAVGTDTFNNTVYAQILNFTGNGAVLLNGQAGLKADGSVGTNVDSTKAGLVGTVDFGANGDTGALQIGNLVNLTTGAGGINFRDANGATLRFLGTSTVTGEVGALATVANTLANSTLKSIYAGVGGNTVTFSNDVHVSGNTFHVGAGTVNLVGDLYGPLLYDADGIVNVSSTKSVKDDPLDATVVGAITTAANNTGTLNYLGSTTVSNDIGTNLIYLKAANFHSDATVAPVTQNIDKNIYATTTTLGNATTGTTANLTATGKFLGNTLALAAANVTLNTAGAVAPSAVSPVDFAHTKNADGTLTNTAAVTDSATGTGVIVANGATMNFAVGTAPYVAGGVNGVISAAGSSSIAGGAGSTLVMNGTEKVNVSLLGSARNGEAYALIDVAVGAAGPQAATLQDNSFVIDTALSRSATGDLVIATSRDANTYVAKSATAGHFSNAAATRQGALAASGTGYTSDMQTVMNTLDIDQWGYGNTQANLANQVKRLVPTANASGILAAFAATSNTLYAVGEHLAVLRGDSAMSDADGNGYHFSKGNSVWMKMLGSTQSNKTIDNYDGFKTTMSGMVLGVDAKLGNGVIGLAGNINNSSIDQKDFRDGDAAKMKTWGVGLYGVQDYGKMYVDGNLGYAHHSLDTNRTAALGRVAKADYNYKQLSAKLAAGYRLNLDDKGTSVLTPILSVEYGNLNQAAYTETGAGALNLNVDSLSTNRTRGSLGLRYNTVLKGGSTSFYPEFLAAVNTQSMGNTDIVARFEGDASGNAFTTTGVNVPNTSYTLGANLRIVPYKAIELQIGYQYEGNSSFSSHLGEIRGTWSF
jgi:outer membrane autotransporter protein